MVASPQSDQIIAEREDFDSYFPLFIATIGLNIEQLPQSKSFRERLVLMYRDWRSRQP